MYISSSLMCRAVKGLGPDVVESSVLSGPLANHAATCLRCQAEAARHRRLRRELAGLADQVEPAPARLAPAVERAIAGTAGPVAPRSPGGRLAATVAGATAAAASAAAVAIWRRSRATA